MWIFTLAFTHSAISSKIGTGALRLKMLLFNYVYVYMSVHEGRCPRRLEEDTRCSDH